MAWRLGDFVLEGYFNNSRRNCTFGHLLLRGAEMPLTFELTGDPGEDLRGRVFEFTARGADAMGPPPPDEGLAWRHIGPTGSMEWSRVKDLKGDVADLKRGKPLRYEWKPRLYLEWYSQNGRVVVELLDPEIRLLDGDPLPDPEYPEENATRSGPSVTMLQHTENDRIEVTTFRPKDEAADDGPEDIEAYLERLNEETEARIRGEDPEFMREMNIMEESLEGDAGEILGSLLEPRQLPSPSDVDEERAEILVKSILVELALLSVAVHLCEHCTMREGYRYIVEEVLREGRVHPELKTTGWVQHYNYGEECARCEERILREYEEPGGIGDA